MPADQRETCPKCGEPYKQQMKWGGAWWTSYECGSGESDKGEFVQGDRCRIRELEARLSAAESKLAKLERVAEEARKLQSYMVRDEWTCQTPYAGFDFYEMNEALAALKETK